ncbi:MAG: 2-hydroxyacid dehydrogenase [Rhodococcus sp. (in: high G+C Gram-positive bacteria)]|nr:2-hydroxyacid dehydrogenase [Rhodococcus sp. (in: high G+C Gram-positive bacteria)]MDI6627939.1 2-hydroxyacid dehydrogenase [Rhodococcus sp. (in: high G+C Gram-positive bacteria)]
MVTVSSQKTSVSQSDSQRGGRVLRVGPLKPSLMDTLVAEYDALELPEGDDRDEFLSEHGASISAVVTSGRTGVDAALMERLPQLGAVVNFGVGYDTTDVDAAAERGIAVSNTPDVLTDCVADLAVGLVIDTVRGLSSAERFVRAGRWPSEGNTPLTRQVTGKRVGIIGLGRIGSAIADRLNGFRCEISYHNRNEIDGSPYVYAASPTALAENVDILIIAASGGSGTAHLVDRAVLEALGPQGYLINVARGSVVDEEALIELLAAGKLAGAGLDVFAHEPNVPDALVAMDNVVLLPHVGSATVETRAAMEALTLENLDRFLADGTLVTPVAQ